jgi:hypothetical protein
MKKSNCPMVVDSSSKLKSQSFFNKAVFLNMPKDGKKGPPGVSQSFFNKAVFLNLLE